MSVVALKCVVGGAVFVVDGMLFSLLDLFYGVFVLILDFLGCGSWYF